MLSMMQKQPEKTRSGIIKLLADNPIYQEKRLSFIGLPEGNARHHLNKLHGKGKLRTKALKGGVLVGQWQRQRRLT